MTTPVRRRPPGRYDDPRRVNRALVVPAAVVLGGLVSAGAVALYLRHQEGTLAHQLRGYVVSSPTAVEVRWEVRLRRGERGECQLKATGETGRQVGVEVVPVGPGTGGTLRVEHLLTTTARASTAEVTGCRALPSP